MTCIVGINQGRTVWIGGDSAMTGGDLGQGISLDPKVFIIADEFAFGICGSPKLMNVLCHNFDIKKQKTGDDNKYFCSEFITSLKEAFVAGGCTVDHPEHGTCFEGELLAGYRGRLYRIQSNFQIITDAYGFTSVGSGSDIAIGSLHATKNDHPKRRILKALEASAIANAAVRPPFNIVSVTKSIWK